MGVVYIGDRQVGKTHLATELSNPRNEYVKVSSLDYEFLKANLLDENSNAIATSDEKVTYEQYLDIRVRLPTGNKQVVVDWIDTPGEVWRKSWQIDNSKKWKRILKTIRQSEGILLILPPHRGLMFKPRFRTSECSVEKYRIYLQ